jgi:hypothetical protein
MYKDITYHSSDGRYIVYRIYTDNKAGYWQLCDKEVKGKESCMLFSIEDIGQISEIFNDIIREAVEANDNA